MERPNPPSEESRFFEHGRVFLAARDFVSRTAALDITLPCCLFQAVIPQLLGAGFVDHPQIHQPISVWMPRLSGQRINVFGGPSAADQVNSSIRGWLTQLLKIFEKLSPYLNDASDLIPMLPLGVYVDIRWRCSIDNILRVMEGIQHIGVAGIPEFQWALSTVLYCALDDFSKWESLCVKAAIEG